MCYFKATEVLEYVEVQTLICLWSMRLSQSVQIKSSCHHHLTRLWSIKFLRSKILGASDFVKGREIYKTSPQPHNTNTNLTGNLAESSHFKTELCSTGPDQFHPERGEPNCIASLKERLGFGFTTWLRPFCVDICMFTLVWLLSLVALGSFYSINCQF